MDVNHHAAVPDALVRSPSSIKSDPQQNSDWKRHDRVDNQYLMINRSQKIGGGIVFMASADCWNFIAQQMLLVQILLVQILLA